MSWKDIVKNEEEEYDTTYEEDARDEYEDFLKLYKMGKPMADDLLKRFNTIKKLFNDFNFDRFFRQEKEFIKDIKEALNYTVQSGDNYFNNIRAGMNDIYENFTMGELGGTSIARQKRDEMKNMLDEMYWEN